MPESNLEHGARGREREKGMEEAGVERWGNGGGLRERKKGKGVKETRVGRRRRMKNSFEQDIEWSGKRAGGYWVAGRGGEMEDLW